MVMSEMDSKGTRLCYVEKIIHSYHHRNGEMIAAVIMCRPTTNFTVAKESSAIVDTF